MSSTPQRKQSWSFSLTAGDCYSSSSSQEEGRPPPPRRAAEQDRLIAEAEQEGVPEYPPPELYDIAQIEEGEVRFRETPFTIARRVAATRKRARDDDEETGKLQVSRSWMPRCAA